MRLSRSDFLPVYDIWIDALKTDRTYIVLSRLVKPCSYRQQAQERLDTRKRAAKQERVQTRTMIKTNDSTRSLIVSSVDPSTCVGLAFSKGFSSFPYGDEQAKFDHADTKEKKHPSVRTLAADYTSRSQEQTQRAEDGRTTFIKAKLPFEYRPTVHHHLAINNLRARACRIRAPYPNTGLTP
jgi:hypothetical protein